MDPPLLFSASDADKVKTSSQKGSAGQPAGAIEDILNSILPPREFMADGIKYIQYVAKDAPTRPSVHTLQEALDEKLVERQARVTGICPVREDLYSQTFDELIRQVTLNCPERGLLLLRVRDEVKMTIDAYKTLYESSVTFGVRKQLEAEQGMDDLEKQVKELEDRKKQLDSQIKDLISESEVMDKRNNESRQYMHKKRKHEIDCLEYQGDHFQQFLKSISSSAGK
jgi:dynein light intermediate chain